MKSNKLCLLFLFLLILSAGLVSAGDVNQTDTDDLELSDADMLLSEGDKSYADLNETISKASTVVNLTEDYKFNGSDEDYIEVTLAEGDTLTINGNNRVIDGNNVAGAFKFINGAVFINNLTFRNCGQTAIKFMNCQLTTNNVIFENNSNENSAGAVLAYQSMYNSYNDTFTDNYAPDGSAIYSVYSMVHVENSVLMNSNPIRWSLIKGMYSDVTVLNSLFANTTSRYATAVYNENGRTYIKNTKFMNLFADATAGAIGVKQSILTIIENCEFINVNSAKNGGAVYADINGPAYDSNGTTIINRTLFKDCTSEFGGAVLQLGGNLRIIYSNFTDNFADYNGGALYTSYVNLYMECVNFTGNTAESDNYTSGGAIFFDCGDAEIEYSSFTNNTAFFGGAIYAYDSHFKVENSAFLENGQAIHGVFVKEGSYYRNVSLADVNPDTFDLDDVNYVSVIDVAGNKIVLNPIGVTGNVNDSCFDLRSFNAVTPVKNQGAMGACWVFGANGALESAFLMATNITMDLSENNVQNSMLRYSIYGNPLKPEGGTIVMGMLYYLSWMGIVDTQYDSYDELGKISPILFTPNCYHILDAVLIDTNNVTAVKEALIKYGALTIVVNGADPNTEFFNPITTASYCNNPYYGNHIVTLVGWNDTFSKNNFGITPPDDGAWIVKNSWGENWGDGGYFYLSYYDEPLRINPAVGYIINNTDVYNKLYEYDITGWDEFKEYDSNIVNYTNAYQSVGNDLISAVGTYFEKGGVDYTIYIAVNGTPIYSQSGKSLYYGHQTIKLDKLVSVKEGENFTVTIQANKVPYISSTRLHYEKGTSYVDAGGYIDDLSAEGMAACLKVYTMPDLSVTENIQQYYSTNKQFTVNVNESNVSVSVFFNGRELINVTDENGTAVFTLQSLNPGVYVIETMYNNITVINTLAVLNTIDVPKSVTAGYNSNIKITATFYDGNGDVAGVKTVSLKDYKIGNHVLTFTNPFTNQTVKSAVKIVSRFTDNKNINMYYFDGSSYSIKVYGDNGKLVGKNKVVTVKIGKKTYKVKTNAKGVATLKIPKEITPGTYKITAYYAGQTVKNTLKVKQVLKAGKVTVKKSAKKLVLKATLKNGKKVVKGKTITFKFNGKTYKVKTNAKGIAQKVLKKSVIKKLRKGKTYTVKVTYLKNVVKTTVKVK